MSSRGQRFVLLEVPEGRTLHYDNGREIVAGETLEDIESVVTDKVGGPSGERQQLYGGTL